MLQAYDWPGNIRELKNVIERFVIMNPSNIITAKNILIGESTRSDYFAFNTLKEARDAFEKDFIAKKLEENNWNISKTSEILDIERSNLHRKIKVYEIKTPINPKNYRQLNVAKKLRMSKINLLFDTTKCTILRSS